jgi:hypothetical protein
MFTLTYHDVYVHRVWDLWCLVPISTIFQLYSGCFIGGGNRRKPSHNVPTFTFTTTYHGRSTMEANEANASLLKR